MFGPLLPARLPERVQTTIRQDQDQTEILVSLMQLLAVASFAALYALTPKAFNPATVPFEPVPVTLAVYSGFTLIRLWLAWQHRLRAWFLALSVVVDITVLMVTIWSFHLQYQQPPALYLKAPTMLYAFILIALRTLRFEPWLVLLAGISAAVGWLALVAYAVLAEGGAQITHDFATYAMSYQVLLGAEVDKAVSVLMVTLILTLGLVRARKLLFRAVTDQVAASELSRFFAPEVAGRIRASEIALEPGQAELREAAILMVDLRGFTPLTPSPRAARGDGAPLRVPVAGGRRGRRSWRQHRQVPRRRHPRELRRHPAQRQLRRRRLARARRAARGDRGLGRGAARRGPAGAQARRRGRHRAGDVRHHRRPQPARVHGDRRPGKPRRQAREAHQGGAGARTLHRRRLPTGAEPATTSRSAPPNRARGARSPGSSVPLDLVVLG